MWLALINGLLVSLLFAQSARPSNKLVATAAVCGASKYIQLLRSWEWHSDTGALGCALKPPALPRRLSGHHREAWRPGKARHLESSYDCIGKASSCLQSWWRCFSGSEMMQDLHGHTWAQRTLELHCQRLNCYHCLAAQGPSGSAAADSAGAPALTPSGASGRRLHGDRLPSEEQDGR